MMKFDLEKYRQIGDPKADEAISQLVEKEGFDSLRRLFPFLSDYKNLDFGNQSKVIQVFINENCTFPSIFNSKDVIRACEFYQKNQQNIGIVLALYSLPYCYLGADGAKVLYLSERIRNDTTKRLTETGQFLKSVLNYDNWQSKDIFLICNKVRLLHATIRFFTIHSKKWDMNWGYPVNQEDMAGTNMAFSWIVLKGLEKMGVNVDKSYEKAYLNTWNVIGFFLGVNTELLPINYRNYYDLDKQIALRQFKESLEGKELAAALITTIRNFAPNSITADLLQEQSRSFLGEEYAKMLGIQRTKVPNTLLEIYSQTSILMNQILEN